MSFSEVLWLFVMCAGIRQALIPIGNMAKLFGFRRFIAQGFFPLSVLLAAYLVQVLKLNHNLDFLQNLFLGTAVVEIIICIWLLVQNKNSSLSTKEAGV